MNELIYNQLKILLVFFITGICIGFIFDFFRIQRKVFKLHDFITYIQDALFWIISGFLFAFVAVKYTSGELRMYMLLGIVLGVLVYFKFVSRFFIRINTCILNLVIKFIQIVISPFKKIIKKIKKNWKKNNNMV